MPFDGGIAQSQKGHSDSKEHTYANSVFLGVCPSRERAAAGVLIFEPDYTKDPDPYHQRPVKYLTFLETVIFQKQLILNTSQFLKKYKRIIKLNESSKTNR